MAIVTYTDAALFYAAPDLTNPQQDFHGHFTCAHKTGQGVGALLAQVRLCMVDLH